MRYPLALVIISALLFGCGDGSDGHLASGGSAGGGGTAGEGGAGGERLIETSRAYVTLLPIPPCEKGTVSDYRVENILIGPGVLESRFPNCAEGPAGDDSTITCPMDEDGIEYMITLVRDGPGVRSSGRIEACTGFLLRDVRPATNEVVVDVFVSAATPCEQGVPSNYTVDVFVDGSTDPVVVTGDFGDCTGAIDSQRNTIACPNDGASMPFAVSIGEGFDWEVSIDGTLETCAGVLLR